MAAKLKIEGLKELDAALGELSKGAARGVLHRTLIKAGEPMRAAAERNAPKDKGNLSRSIKLSSKIDNRAGKAAYAEVMKAGGTKSDAVSALRDARRAAGAGESFAEVFMGPVKSGKRNSIKAMAQEFGARHHPPHPYMRPAFDSQANAVLDGIKTILGAEIGKAAKRAQARAMKKARG